MIESWYRWWVIWRTCVMWTCIRVLWTQVLRIRCRVRHRRPVSDYYYTRYYYTSSSSSSSSASSTTARARRHAAASRTALTSSWRQTSRRLRCAEVTTRRTPVYVNCARSVGHLHLMHPFTRLSTCLRHLSVCLSVNEWMSTARSQLQTTTSNSCSLARHLRCVPLRHLLTYLLTYLSSIHVDGVPETIATSS